MQLNDQDLLQGNAYINGEWVSADNGETLPVLNPATGETIKIAAKTVLKFRIAKAAKDAVLG